GQRGVAREPTGQIVGRVEVRQDLRLKALAPFIHRIDRPPKALRRLHRTRLARGGFYSCAQSRFGPKNTTQALKSPLKLSNRWATWAATKSASPAEKRTSSLARRKVP